MNEIRILLIGMSNDCAAYWHSYYKIGIIWGIVFALFYCSIPGAHPPARKFLAPLRTELR